MFCQADLIVESTAPSKTSLKVMPGPTHIILDWKSPSEGWITSYKIHVVPTKTSNKTRRSERADNLTTSHLFVSQNGSVDYESKEIEFSKSRPPINITNLQPETEYNFVITISLNEEWKTTLNLDDVTTTANNSLFPEGIIGFTMTNAEYKAAELSIFSIIMALISLTIIIFIISGTLPVHADNAVQVCFEVSLLSCHVFTLLGFIEGPLAWNPEDQTNCIVAMVAFSYFSMCAFIFLFLESLCIANQLIYNLNVKNLEKIPILVVSGFLAPLLYLAIVVPIAYKDLIPQTPKVCWLNLDNPESAVILTPIVILSLCSFIIMFFIIFKSSSKDELQSSDHYTNRTPTLHKILYIDLAIVALMTLGWTFGFTASHFQEDILVILFLVAHFFIAVLVFGFRCLMDDQVQ